VKTVSFFNHKGGVGKTTLVFNIGLALGRMGKKVLFVDADAQTNLTGSALPAEQYEEAVANHATIYDALLPVIRTTGDFQVVPPHQIRDNVWLLPGNIRLSEFEAVLPASWNDSLGGQFQGFQRTTAFYRLVQAHADVVGAQYTLVDLGPSVGALNRLALLASDGFVVPLAPDLFSLTALPSVGKSLSDWIGDWGVARVSAARTHADQELPSGSLFVGKPKPLGYISQQFASYRSAPAAAFQRWLKDIPDAYQTEVVKRLEKAGIDAPSGRGELGTIRNLSSLVPMAQEQNAAIFELTGAEARGSQYTRAKDTLADFQRLGAEIIRRLDEK
jgi:chromosome partitioning protein